MASVRNYLIINAYGKLREIGSPVAVKHGFVIKERHCSFLLFKNNSNKE